MSQYIKNGIPTAKRAGKRVRMQQSRTCSNPSQEVLLISHADRGGEICHMASVFGESTALLAGTRSCFTFLCGAEDDQCRKVMGDEGSVWGTHMGIGGEK